MYIQILNLSTSWVNSEAKRVFKKQWIYWTAWNRDSGRRLRPHAFQVQIIWEFVPSTPNHAGSHAKGKSLSCCLIQDFPNLLHIILVVFTGNNLSYYTSVQRTTTWEMLLFNFWIAFLIRNYVYTNMERCLEGQFIQYVHLWVAGFQVIFTFLYSLLFEKNLQ